jgi:hypothetical protein
MLDVSTDGAIYLIISLRIFLSPGTPYRIIARSYAWCPRNPLGEIIVVEKPNSKPLVEPADGVVDIPFHQQTKPR